MEVCREAGMVRIKNKMTEIRRRRIAPVIHNYYLNCEQDEEIFALFGQDTVVFWDDDRGVRRAYFCSTNPEELTALLSQVPEGTVIDYLTRTKGEFRDLFESAGWRQLHEMHRMDTKLSAEEEAAMEERKHLFDLTAYREENVRAAVEADCDIIYSKLLEVFDPRESHLCTKEELLEYIQKRWVSVYYEDGVLLGLHIFLVEHRRFYGYQIWTEAGVEGYYSLIKTSEQLFCEFIGETVKKCLPGYSWVNVKNGKSMRLLKFWGQKFDGLYDFVYEKLPTMVGCS